ncbi:threonine/serine exporter family protein [Flexivirga sp. ID2601S]|uniref:Threonine/serine exporter family protein n=1 Tax=Flexivirga aerilata TaxID=1656889 RepID=A0A849AWV7_9MICO|nr:threonine/serine exporter family protein [Flexivirga aerilata]NNG41152.1 threonine/serine exporter family protein [Flexivirga aerilata]
MAIDPTREVLLRIGGALLAGAAPVPDVEAQLIALGHRLGAAEPRVAATPTAVFVSVDATHDMALQTVHGSLRFEQMSRVQDVIDRLMRRRMRAAEALVALDDIEAMPSTRAPFLCDLAVVLIGIGICCILQPTWRDLGVTAVASLLVVGLVWLSRRITLVGTLLPLLASFGVGLLVLQADRLWHLDGTLRTMVSAIAVLLPGSVIVTGMSEIASGAAVAGTSRLVSGMVQLMLFAVGLFAAVSVSSDSLDVLTNVRAQELGPLAPYLGVALVGLGIVLNVAASRNAIPWIFAVLALTFAVQSTVQWLGGVTLGGLAGAIVASLGAALVHRFSGRPLRLVVFLPAFWLLVPGSLGLLSTAELAAGHDGLAAVSTAVSAVVAVAAGTLIGSAAGRALDRRLDPAPPELPEPVDVADVDRH